MEGQPSGAWARRRSQERPNRRQTDPLQDLHRISACKVICSCASVFFGGGYMRALTNGMLFLVAILAIVGIYLFRQQSFGSLQRQFGGRLGREKAHVARHIPVQPTPVPAKPALARSRASSTPQDVQVTVTVIPFEPKPLTDSIQIGTQKNKLWRDFGEPDVSTSSREGERFLETFIYLQDAFRATVIRLVNGTVVSVSATKTVGPPLLVPRTDKARPSVFLTSDSR